MKENYTVSFTLNNVAQCRLVKADSKEQALAYFAEIEPTATIAGAALDQCNLERRGCPVEIVPDGWTPAPAPAAEEEQNTTAIDGEDAPGRDVVGEVREYLESLDDADKVDIWNSYTDATNNPDDYVYRMDEFDEVFSGFKPWEIARTCYYSGNFCPADDWFWFDGYANAVSADYISEHDDRNPVDLDELAQYIADNDEDFYNSDIRAILDGEGVRA